MSESKHRVVQMPKRKDEEESEDSDAHAGCLRCGEVSCDHCRCDGKYLCHHHLPGNPCHNARYTQRLYCNPCVKAKHAFVKRAAKGGSSERAGIGGRRPKPCPWCSELLCDHCRCTGCSSSGHASEGSRCSGSRYRERLVCNSCRRCRAATGKGIAREEAPPLDGVGLASEARLATANIHSWPGWHIPRPPASPTVSLSMTAMAEWIRMSSSLSSGTVPLPTMNMMVPRGAVPHYVNPHRHMEHPASDSLLATGSAAAGMEYGAPARTADLIAGGQLLSILTENSSVLSGVRNEPYHMPFFDWNSPARTAVAAPYHPDFHHMADLGLSELPLITITGQAGIRADHARETIPPTGNEEESLARDGDRLRLINRPKGSSAFK